MTDNWNHVMQYPQTGYIALLEDDNYWLPNHLEQAAEALTAYPEVSLYHAPHREFHERGTAELTTIIKSPWAGGGPILPRTLNQLSSMLSRWERLIQTVVVNSGP